MTRIKRGILTKKKHKKLMKLTKGYQGPERVKTRKEGYLKAGQHAFAGRKIKKRDYRSLWILRIGAKSREFGLSYNRFINGLKKANVELDRKILAHLAVAEPKVFEELVKKAQTGLGKVKVGG